MQTALKDILYFDFDKASSLISQIEDGLSSETTEQHEATDENRNIRKYDLLNIFNAEFGGIEAEKKSALTTKLLHHNLLNKLEEFLFKNNLAVDVNKIDCNATSTTDHIREQLVGFPYIRARGWCAIEDFDRLYEMTEKFTPLSDFIVTSALQSELGRDSLAEEVQVLEAEDNNPKLKKTKSQLQALDQRIDRIVKSRRVPQRIFDGIRRWIDALSRNRLNLRVVPFENKPDLEIVANLKRECFVDQDLDHLLYAYGTQPNIKLAVFGLVTSIPPKDKGKNFDIYAEEELKPSNAPEEISAVEQAFQRMFPSIRSMEEFTSLHHYPRTIIHPIAVYRLISENDIEG